jgi:hypothetical protein
MMILTGIREGRHPEASLTEYHAGWTLEAEAKTEEWIGAVEVDGTKENPRMEALGDTGAPLLQSPEPLCLHQKGGSCTFCGKRKMIHNPTQFKRPITGSSEAPEVITHAEGVKKISQLTEIQAPTEFQLTDHTASAEINQEITEQSFSDAIEIVPQQLLQWETQLQKQRAGKVDSSINMEDGKMEQLQAKAQHDPQNPNILIIIPQKELQTDQQRVIQTTHDLAHQNKEADKLQNMNNVEAKEKEALPNPVRQSELIETNQEECAQQNSPQMQSVRNNDLQLSPTEMDQAVQDQGHQLQDLLRQFKNATSAPLSGFVIQTPQRKMKMQVEVTATQGEATARKRPRIQKKISEGKTMVKLAQDLIAKKYGIIQEKGSLEEMTLQQYLDMYKQPLSDQSMEAILQLTEVAVDKKKKKKKKKKAKEDKRGNPRICQLKRRPNARQTRKRRSREWHQWVPSFKKGTTSLVFLVVISVYYG